ncbi:MAG: MBL fold metallo-hydrolase [Salinivirgaceae bacterium]
MIDVISIFTPEYKSKTYMVVDKDSKSTIIIDPTIFSVTEISNFLLNNNISLDYVIPTHGHFDHIEGISKLQELYGFDVLANSECCEAFLNPKKNYSAFFQNKNVRISLPNIIIDEDIYNLKWNNTEIQIIKTPGHSPCSVCIVFNNLFLFSGDTILQEYSPFSKFPDGDAELLKTSIKRVFSIFPPSTLVYPGHGVEFHLGLINLKFKFLK